MDITVAFSTFNRSACLSQTLEAMTKLERVGLKVRLVQQPKRAPVVPKEKALGLAVLKATVSMSITLGAATYVSI